MPNRTVVQDANDYRVVIFGSACVGKTSLLMRFIEGTFKDTYSPTVEDTHRQVVASDNAVCTLQITDTGGSYSFPAMERLAIQRGQAFILVYAVNNRKSFDNLKNYYNEILSVKSTIEGTPLMIVGNKCDCLERDVTESEGLRLAKQWSCSFIETSAKQEFHTRELFEQLLLLEKRQSMSLTEAQTHKKSGPSKSSKRAENIKNKCILM